MHVKLLCQKQKNAVAVSKVRARIWLQFVNYLNLLVHLTIPFPQSKNSKAAPVLLLPVWRHKRYVTGQIIR